MVTSHQVSGKTPNIGIGTIFVLSSLIQFPGLGERCISAPRHLAQPILAQAYIHPSWVTRYTEHTNKPPQSTTLQRQRIRATKIKYGLEEAWLGWGGGTYPVRKIVINPRSRGGWNNWNDDEKGIGKKEEQNDYFGCSEWGVPAPLAIWRCV